MGIPVRGRLTTLRPAGSGDVERLVVWHLDPGVSRYWDGETFTREEMEQRLGRQDVEAWIEGAVRAWERAGFVELSRHPPDAGHMAEWILMEFRG